MVLGTNPCFFENFGGSGYKFLKKSAEQLKKCVTSIKDQ